MSSNWLEVPKIRKKIQGLNRMIGSVYTEYRCIDGLIIPLVMDNIKSRPLFNNSFFTSSDEDCIKSPFMDKCAVDQDNLNKALQPKVKCYKYENREDGNYLVNKSEDEFKIGVKLENSDIQDSFNYSAIKSFKNLDNLEPIDVYDLTEEDFDKIISYNVLNKVIGSYGGIDVNLIMIKELFPLVKKADSISISSYKNIALPDNIFTISIISKTPVCIFTSIHHIVTM